MSLNALTAHPSNEGTPHVNSHTPLDPSKLLLTVAEAAARLGIGRTLMYELISTGAVRSVTVGRLRRVRVGDLEAYTAALVPQPIRHAA